MKSNLPIDEALYEQGYNQALKDLNGCDWQAFRREAAKDILANLVEVRIPLRPEQFVRMAIEYADELIKQLKGEEK